MILGRVRWMLLKGMGLNKSFPWLSAREIEIPPCVHDVMGGLIFVRTLNLEPHQSTQIPVSDGKKSVMVRVEAQEREDVKTPAGTFKTIRYEVYLLDGVLYKRSAHVNEWRSPTSSSRWTTKS